jgi:hypothetical protein
MIREIGRSEFETPRSNIEMGITVAAIKYLLCLLILLSPLPSFADSANVAPSARVTGTYSSLSYNTDGGDLNGVEIRFVLTRKGIKGVVQFAEGGAGDLALVDVRVTGTHIQFEMPAGSDTEGTFEGTVSAKGLEGTFSYKGGSKEHLTLPRSASYWDKH